MVKERGMRETRQRAVILEALRQTKTHPTADQLFRRVRRRLPRISLGTVYRNLELLCQRGDILKLDVGGGQRRFDADTSSHHHIRCSECGRINDVDGSAPAGFERRFSDDVGYEVTGHRIELIGVCPDCRRRAAG